MKTLLLQELAKLSMAGGKFVSAASALVIVGNTAYTVADDELHLARFELHEPEQGQWIRLTNAILPDEKKARKAQKPDWEAMTLLPGSHEFPYGALMALGSGSTEARMAGCLMALDEQQNVQQPQHFSLAPLYKELQGRLPDLNIEGALVYQSQLILFHRANNQQVNNALVLCDLHAVLDLRHDDNDEWLHSMDIIHCQLPTLHGVVLGITDATLLENGNILFSAAAEATDNSYHDGECVGSVLGVMNVRGELLSLMPLEPVCKVEGVALHHSSQTLYVVTDADNPELPASLYTVDGWKSLEGIS